MKKRFIFVLCSLLAFTLIFSGCQSKSPEEQVKLIEQQLEESKKIAGRLDGTLEVGTQGMTVKAALKSNIKLDNSEDFPKIDFDGDISLGDLGSTNFRIFINKDMIYSSAIGTENMTELTDEDRAQIVSSFKKLQTTGSNENAQIKRTITKSHADKMQLLTVSYDVAELNKQLENMKNNQTVKDDSIYQNLYNSENQPEFKKMEIVYVLNTKREVKEIRFNMEMNIVDGKQTNSINLAGTFFIDSLGSDIEFNAPQIKTTTETTEKKESNSFFPIP